MSAPRPPHPLSESAPKIKRTRRRHQEARRRTQWFEPLERREMLDASELDLFLAGELSGPAAFPIVQTRFGEVTTRIVGGNESPSNAWPWMASLQRNGSSHFCGGSLIDDDWVLTAAHCVVGRSAADFDVVLGRHDLENDIGQRHVIERVEIHPAYSQLTPNDSDIALLKLAVPSNLPTIRLTTAEQSSLFAPGVEATVTGWGALTEGGPGPTKLQEVTLPIVSNETAAAVYGPAGVLITSNMLAAGLSEGGRDSCQGDSGGPLMVSDGEEGFLQAGVVSFGIGCARPNLYGIYARTANFVDWITDLTEEVPPQLTVTPIGSEGVTSDLLAGMLVGDSGITINNVFYQGAPHASGTFSGGGPIIGIDSGILLTSGNVQNVVGPNTSTSAGQANGLAGHPLLDGLVQQTISSVTPPGSPPPNVIPTTRDASILSFDFVPNGNYVEFRYVFGSEEYNEYVGSSFNDVFGFFINGVNYALIPELESDFSEPNHGRDTAWNAGLLAGRHVYQGLSLHQPGDADWFRFETAGAGLAGHTVRVESRQQQVDLALRLYNSAGDFIAEHQGLGTAAALQLGGLAAGTYYAEVYSPRNEIVADYSLALNLPRPLGPDLAEPNPTLQDAFPLGALRGAIQRDGFSIQAADEDWYQFELTDTARAGHFVGIDFQHAAGDLDIQLYDAGGAILASSTSSSNSERISLAGATPLTAGTYYLRVYGFSGAINPDYSIVAHAPLGAPVADILEPNDNLVQALNLGPSAGRLESNSLLDANAGELLSIHSGSDEDWYRFELLDDATSAHFVEVQFEHALGDIDIGLMDAAGNLLAGSTSVANEERVSLAGRPAGVYYLKVYGHGDATNPSYDFVLETPSDPLGQFQIPIAINSVNRLRNSHFYVDNESLAETQRLTLVGDPTAGTVTLQLHGQTVTAALGRSPYATALNLQSALATLDGLQQVPQVFWQDDGVSEQQRIRITGSPTGGAIELDYDGESTGPISFAEDPYTTAQNIQQALTALDSLDYVTVNGSDNSRDELQQIKINGKVEAGSMVLAYNGETTGPIDLSQEVYSIAAAIQTELQALPGSGLNSDFYVWGLPSGGTNEIQEIEIAGAPLTGEFTIQLGGQSTAPIPYTRDRWQTAQQIDSALRALSPPVYAGDFYVTPLQDGGDELQRLVATGGPSGGTFQLALGGEQTAAIPFSRDFFATAEAIRTALVELDGVQGGVTVSAVHNAIDEWQQIDLLGAPDGGSFTLSLGGEATAPISWSEDAQLLALNIQQALANLTELTDDLSVSFVGNGSFHIQFYGTNGALDWPQIAVADNQLTGTGAGILTSSIYEGFFPTQLEFLVHFVGSDGNSNPPQLEFVTAGNALVGFDNPSLAPETLVEGAAPTFQKFQVYFYSRDGFRDQPNLAVSGTFAGGNDPSISARTITEGQRPDSLTFELQFFGTLGDQNLSPVEIQSSELIGSGPLSVIASTIVEGAAITEYVFDVEFAGSSGMLNVAELGASAALLEGGTAPAVAVETIREGHVSSASLVRNEQQQIKISGNPSQGTFRLNLLGQTTGPIEYARDPGTMANRISTALNALSEVNSVVVAGVDNGVDEQQMIQVDGQVTDGSIQLQFGSATTLAIDFAHHPSVIADALGNALRQLPGSGLVGDVLVTPSYVGGVDEWQWIDASGDPTGGTFTLSINGATTDPISYSRDFAETASSIDHALRELEGSGLHGDFSVSPFHDGINERQTLTVLGNPAGGTFQLEMNGERTGDIAFSQDFLQTADNIQEALIDLTSIVGDLFVWAYHDGVNESQLLSFSGLPTGGSFTLSFQGEETTPILYSTDPWALSTNIYLALTALDSLTDDLQVLPTFDGSIQIDFLGANGAQDQPLIEVSQNNLAGTSPDLEVENWQHGAAPTTLQFNIDFFGRDGATDQPEITFAEDANQLTGGTLPSMFSSTPTPGQAPSFLSYQISFFNRDGLKDQPQITVDSTNLTGDGPVSLIPSTAIAGERPSSLTFVVDFFGGDGDIDQPQLSIVSNTLQGPASIVSGVTTERNGAAPTEATYVIEFLDNLDATDIPQMTASSVSFLGGSSPQISITTLQHGFGTPGTIFDIQFAAVDGNQPAVQVSGDFTGGTSPSAAIATVTDGNGVSRNTQLDGTTTVMHLVAPVNPGVPNTVWLAVADTSDEIYDSAVFIGAESLTEFVTGDFAEPNDRLAEAFILGAIETATTIDGLTIHRSGNDDWFRFSLSRPADQLSAVAASFNNAAGDLDLELYTAEGILLRASRGSADLERINLDGLPAATYYVRVSGYQGATNPDYSLTVQPPILAVLAPDAFEVNDTAETASNLREVVGLYSVGGPGQLNLHASNDLDWFRFQTTAVGGATDRVKVTFSHTQGDLDLQLYRDDGAGNLILVGTSAGVGDMEQLSLHGQPAGTYFVKVYGFGGATNPGYELTITAPVPTISGDWAEPNDARETAFDLREVSGLQQWTGLSIHATGNDDWFRVETVAAGGAGDFVRVNFLHASGDVDLQLYDAGGTVLRSSTSVANEERIRLTGLSAGVYFVRVYGYSGVTNPQYDLTVQGPMAVVAGDWAEPNDTRETAFDLREIQGERRWENLTIHPAANDDWFRFVTVATGGASDHVRINFRHASGDIDLRLLDANGNAIGGSGGVSDEERISLNGLPAGVYYLRAFGYNNITNPDYDLTINAPVIVVPGDWAEPNDTRAGAFDLREVQGERTWHDLSIHPAANDDWFRFVTAATGGQRDHVRINFLHADGDIDFRLTNADGIDVGGSSGVGNEERISLHGLPAGVYYVRAFGYSNATNPNYALTIAAPFAALPVDWAEPNDAPQTAYDFRTLEGPFTAPGLNLHTANNEDWFGFSTSATGGTADGVEIAFQHVEGDLDLRLFRQDGAVTLQIPAGGGSALTDGQSFTIQDFDGALTFEFDSNGQVEQANVAIPFSLNSTQSQVANTIAGLFSSGVHLGNGLVELRGTATSVAPEYSVRAYIQIVELDQIPGIQAGEAFDAQVRFVDLRELHPGVFSAYADFLFDPTVVRADSITHAYSFTPTGTIDNEAGLIDELGGVRLDSVPHGVADVLVATVRMTAIQAGIPLLQLESADDVFASPVLLWDSNDDHTSTTHFGTSIPESLPSSISVNADFGFVTSSLEGLVASTGMTLVGESSTVGDLQRVSLQGQAAGRYLVQVYGFENASNPRYELRVQAPVPTIPGDWAEPNDARAAAFDLRELQGTSRWENLSIHPAGNDDWFRFQMVAAGGQGDHLRINFQHTQGDVDLQLTDEAGTVVRSATGVGNEERVSLNGLPAGVYYARIYGYGNATNPDYDMTITAPVAVVPGDWAEPNDTLATSYDLREIQGLRTVTGLSVHQAGNEDFFRFVTLAAGQAGNHVRINFLHANGDLDLQLVNSAGHVLRTSETVSNQERISLNGLPAGEYFVRVYGNNNALNPQYDLTIDTPLAPVLDWAEPNDNLAGAYNLRTLEGRHLFSNLSIDPAANEDWFRFRIPSGGIAGNHVRVNFQHAHGDLDLWLYDAAGNPIGSSESVANEERVSLNRLSAGVYYVRVAGVENAKNPFYELTIDAPFAPVLDWAEPNDTRNGAYDLRVLEGLQTFTGLSIDPAANEDWFKFEISDRAAAGNHVRINFQHANGDIDLWLYNADGEPIASSQTVANEERVDLNRLSAGVYYARVAGVNNAKNPLYELTVDAPLAPALDWAEPNDDQLGAYDLRTVEGLQTFPALSIDPAANEDWFKFQLSATGGAGNHVRINFQHAHGDIDLWLHDADGNVVGRSETVGDEEYIDLRRLPAGVYFVRVAGVNDATNPSYELTIDAPFTPLLDWAEPNDSQAGAYNLRSLAGTHTFSELSIDPAENEDWFKFRIAAIGGQGDHVRINTLHANGDIDVWLHDANGNLVGSSQTVADEERISLNRLPAGEYFVRVAGIDAARNPFYELTIVAPQTPVLDWAEPNDSLAAAYNLRTIAGTSTFSELSIDPAANEDWFKFTLAAAGAIDSHVRINFLQARGDLDLWLRDSQGNLLASSETVADEERISLHRLPAGDYFIQVSGVNGARNPAYELTISGPAAPVLDWAEPNDDRQGAYNLRVLEGVHSFAGLSIDPAENEDWFTFETTATSGVGHHVRINFLHANGDLDLWLYDADGNVLRSSLSAADEERVELRRLPAGEYFVRVAGLADVKNPDYGLTIEAPLAPQLDWAEPNDTLATAYNLRKLEGAYTFSNLSIDPTEDQDWFRFEMPAVGGVGHHVRLNFTHTQGDIDLSLHNVDGDLLASSETVGDEERVELRWLPAGEYFIRIAGVDGAVNPQYSLTVDAPVTPVLDWAEPNDTLATAHELRTIEGDYTFAPLSIDPAENEDWFRFRISNPGTAEHHVRINFAHARGDIDLALFDLNGNQLGSSETARDEERISLARLPAGEYWIRVAGVEGTRNPEYFLTVDAPDAPVLDWAEPNDSLAGAYDLRLVEGERVFSGLSIDPATNEDWFTFQMTAAGAAGNHVRINFLHAEGDIDLWLHDANGELIGTSQTVADEERISLNRLPAGEYYVRAAGLSGDRNPRYELVIDAPYAPVLDWAEPNDTREQAYDLRTVHGQQTFSSLSIDPAANEDFFRFVTTGQGESDHHVRINFVHGQGDIDLYLYDATGTLINSSQTSADQERISLHRLAAGEYFVRVAGVDGAKNPFYELTVSAPEAPDPDWAEPNDTREFAYNLRSIVGTQTFSELSVDPSNDDWFQFTTQAQGDAGNHVRVNFLHARGDLDLWLYDAAGNEIGRSQTVGDEERIGLRGLAAGMYFVRIAGVNGVHNPAYEITVDAPPAPILDWAEPNDDRDGAYDLRTIGGVQWFSELTLDPAGNEDWFRFETPAVGGTGHHVRINFLHANGDIDLQLYDAAGNLLDSSETVLDEERISLHRLPAGEYYIRVSGADDVRNPAYQLTVDGPLEPVLDWAEPNDSRAGAYNLRLVEGLQQFVQLSIDPAENEDWFQFQTVTTGAAGNHVRINFLHANGDIDLWLYDATGNLISQSHSAQNEERLTLAGLPAGEYYVRVAGLAGVTNPDYTLSIDGPVRPVLDWAEPNDDIQSAYDLRIIEGAWNVPALSIDPAMNEDWFRFETLATGVVGNHARINFLHANGDIDLWLYNSNGEILRSSLTVADEERVDLNGLPAGEYFIRVAGVHNARNAYYELSVEAPAGPEPDWAEANDTLETAYDLRAVEGLQVFSNLSIDVAGNEDWFRFELLAEGQPQHQAEIAFEGSAGQLLLELFDEAGNRLAFDGGASGSGLVSLDHVTAGTYYLRILGVAGATNPSYSLTILAPELPPPGTGLLLDRFEFNDTQESAFDLRTLTDRVEEGQLSLHDGSDVDWYRFTTTGVGTANHFIEIRFLHELGDLDLELYDEAGFIATSDSTANVERLSFENLPAGNYFVRVLGYSGASNPDYSLTIEPPMPASLVPDRFETNDTAEQATVLRNTVDAALAGSQSVSDLSIHHAGDEDYFRFRTVGTSSAAHRISVLYHAGDGELTLELLNEDQEPVGILQTSPGSATVNLEGLPAATYFARIAAAGGTAHSYRLMTDLPQAPQTEVALDEWTVFVYITASDLERYAFADVNELEIAASQLPGSVNLAVLWDQSSRRTTYATGGGTQAAWGTTGRALITPDTQRNTVATSFELLGELNTGDPQTLVNFLEWGSQVAPAKRYALVMWDHGAGIDGFNFDNADSHATDWLTTAELKLALESVEARMDLLSFDACLMAMAEVGYEVRELTDVFVASQEVVGGDGHDYTTLFEVLYENPERVTAEALGTGFVQSYQRQYGGGFSIWDTHSAIRTSGYDDLVAFLNAFAGTVADADDAVLAAIAAARDAAIPYEFEELRDLNSFMNAIRANAAIPSEIRDAAADVIQAVNEMVIARTTDTRNSSGISAFMPAQIDGALAGYLADYGAFATATGWASFLAEVGGTLGGGGTGGGRSIMRPDWAERNDFASQAFHLQTLSGDDHVLPRLSLHTADDQDWYRFTIAATGEAGDQVSLQPTNPESSMTLRVYDQNGQHLVGESATGPGEQAVSLSGLAAGTYYVQVLSDAAGAYELHIDAPGGDSHNDWAGNNSSPEKAYNLGQVTGQFFVSGLGVEDESEDWFTFDTPRLAGTTSFMLTITAAEGQFLRAEILDEDENFLGSGNGEGAIQIPFNVSGSGERLSLVVYGGADFNRSLLTTGFSLLFEPANTPPTVDSFAALPLFEDPGEVRFDVTGISAGTGDVQPVQLTAVSNTPAIIPSVVVEYTVGSPTGTLVFTPTAHAHGTAQITITVTDSGPNGVFGDEDDASTVETLTVSITEQNDVPVLTNPGNRSIPEKAAFPLTLNVIDPDAATGVAESITFSLASPVIPGMNLNPTTGLFTWTPTELQDGEYEVVFGASDSRGGVAIRQTIMIEVTEVNDPPVLANPGNKSGNEKTTIAFSLSATDQDIAAGTADTVSYSIVSGGLAGMQLAAGTGVFSWTPAEAQDGEHIVVFGARDSQNTAAVNQTITITVTEVNDPPVLANPGNKSGNEKTAIAFSLAATDLDVTAGAPDTISYSIVSGGLDGMQLIAGTGAFSWTPTEAQDGEHVVVFGARDSQNTAAADRTITITVTEMNDPPVLANPGNKSGNEKTAIAFSLAATDLDVTAGDPDTIRYTIVSGGLDGMTLNVGTGAFAWTPTEAQDGEHVVVFGARDSQNTAAVSQTITITVTDVNDPPLLANPGNKSGNEKTAIAFSLAATDLDVTAGDPDSISYSIVSGGLNGMQLNADTGAFTWTPTEAQDGEHIVVFGARDSQDAVAVNQTITITVTDVNDPPVLANPGNKTGNEKTAIAFSLAATDLDVAAGDPDTISYSIVSGGLDGMQLNTATGAFTWTPTEAQDGQHVVVFGARDSLDTAGANQTITITVAELNDPPVLANPGPQAIAKLTELTFTLQATDADIVNGQPDEITYRISAGMQTGMSLDSSSGLFRWTPSDDQEGLHEVTFEAADTGDTTHTRTVTITVTASNQAPTDISLSATTVPENAAGVVVGDVTVVDPDVGGSHVFTVSDSRFEVSEGQLRLKSTVEINFELTPSIELEITAADLGLPALAVTQTFTISVQDVNDPPAGLQLSNSSVKENVAGAVIGELSATDEDGDTVTFTTEDPRFEVVDGVLKLRAGSFLELATATTVTVEIIATDAGEPSRSTTDSFEIEVLLNPRAWQNTELPVDTNGDGVVVPLDALRIINQLNDPTILSSNGRLPTSRDASSTMAYFDTNGDGFCTTNDVLRVINYLNNLLGEGEGAIGVGGQSVEPLLGFGAQVMTATITESPTRLAERSATVAEDAGAILSTSEPPEVTTAKEKNAGPSVWDRMELRDDGESDMLDAILDDIVGDLEEQWRQ